MPQIPGPCQSPNRCCQLRDLPSLNPRINRINQAFKVHFETRTNQKQLSKLPTPSWWPLGKCTRFGPFNNFCEIAVRFLFLISFVASFIPNNGVLLACTPCLRCLSFRYCSSLTVPEASRKFMCTRPSGIYSLSVLASDLVPIATETQHAINCKSSFQKFIGFFVFIHTLWYEVIMIYNLHM